MAVETKITDPLPLEKLPVISELSDEENDDDVFDDSELFDDLEAEMAREKEERDQRHWSSWWLEWGIVLAVFAIICVVMLFVLKRILNASKV